MNLIILVNINEAMRPVFFYFQALTGFFIFITYLLAYADSNGILKGLMVILPKVIKKDHFFENLIFKSPKNIKILVFYVFYDILNTHFENINFLDFSHIGKIDWSNPKMDQMIQIFYNVCV